MKIVAVMSGKGGVGKSTVCALAALALSENAKVILLDFDLCGPSISAILNAHGKVFKSEVGLVPIAVTKSLHVLSMSNLIRESESVIWRGPKKTSALNMFFESVGEYDYVVIDTPPGLAEEHWFLCDKDVRSIIVSTPQNVALSDTAHTINFCHGKGIEIVGLFENMAGLTCEKCACVTNVFGAKGGEQLAKEHGVRYLGTLPIDRSLIAAMTRGDVVDVKHSLPSYKIVRDIIKDI